MKVHLQSLAIICCVIMGCLLADRTAQARNEPVTAQTVATTQAASATFDLHGTVSVDAGDSLQSPDLTRVVVYLASDPKLDSVNPPQGHATIAQQHKSFVPNFTVVERRTEVEFPNFDDFDHNVFSLSKAAPSFDLDRYPKGKSKSRVFDKVGVVQVFCNIHPSMRAIVVVTPNPYFARADGKGNFTIHNVPPGAYQIVAWQERCGDLPTPVTLNADGSATDINIHLHANRRSIVASEAPPADRAYGVERGLGVKRECLNCPVVTDVHDAKDPEPK